METKIRFNSALWANRMYAILIGGAGGIGSWLAFFLARTNSHILHVVDPDIVSEVNLGGQFYGKKDINKTKLSALENNINILNTPPALFFGFNKRIEEVEGIEEFEYVFSGFDNMDARRHLFNRWKSNPDRKLFVDARLLAEQYEVFFVQKGMEEKYEATLFDQSESFEAACTFKSTTHWAAMCAARMVHGFNAFLANEHHPDTYELPFHHLEIGITWQTNVL